jgi:hypothetical protein
LYIINTEIQAEKNKKMKKLFVTIITLGVGIGLNSQITTYSGSYGFSGANMDQTEVQFSLETSYQENENFSQLYRWRYATGQNKGFIFEYNNRAYFSRKRDLDNSKWYVQGKIGYGIMKGMPYLPNSVFILNENNNTLEYNTDYINDSRHFTYNYGLGLGYKFILFDRLTFDLLLGYVKYSTPNFNEKDSKYSQFRLDDWNNGIAYPLDFTWSLGFFLD